MEPARVHGRPCDPTTGRFLDGGTPEYVHDAARALDLRARYLAENPPTQKAVTVTRDGPMRSGPRTDPIPKEAVAQMRAVIEKEREPWVATPR